MKTVKHAFEKNTSTELFIKLLLLWVYFHMLHIHPLFLSITQNCFYNCSLWNLSHTNYNSRCRSKKNILIILCSILKKYYYLKRLPFILRISFAKKNFMNKSYMIYQQVASSSFRLLKEIYSYDLLINYDVNKLTSHLKSNNKWMFKQKRLIKSSSIKVLKLSYFKFCGL